MVLLSYDSPFVLLSTPVEPTLEVTVTLIPTLTLTPRLLDIVYLDRARICADLSKTRVYARAKTAQDGRVSSTLNGLICLIWISAPLHSSVFSRMCGQTNTLMNKTIRKMGPRADELTNRAYQRMHYRMVNSSMDELMDKLVH